MVQYDAESKVYTVTVDEVGYHFTAQQLQAILDDAWAFGVGPTQAVAAISNLNAQLQQGEATWLRAQLSKFIDNAVKETPNVQG